MDFVGMIVSLDCGETLGIYQGQVKKIDSSLQLLTIVNAFRNGLKCEMPEITISAHDINDIKILKSFAEAKTVTEIKSTPSKITKPVEKAPACARISPVKHVSSDWQTQFGYKQNGGQKKIPAYEDSVRRRTPVSDDGGRAQNNSKKPTTPRKNDPNSQQSRRRLTPRQDCFNVPNDTYLDDFDFEKNLALFDKKSSQQEFETLEDGRYKGTEDVLQKRPLVLRQIILPKVAKKEYTTDSGLVVPSVTVDERLHLQSQAELCGYTESRLLESVGRSSSEMVMQLLGGSNRLNPNNRHQLPVVVVLCGPHLQGAQGIACARHLSNHNVHTTVFVPPSYNTTCQHLHTELMMYSHTGMKLTSEITGLPDVIDLIVYSMDSHHEDPCRLQVWFRMLTEWANRKRAPVFAIDPPPSQVMIHAKWTMAIGLPYDLPENLGQVYLCDLGWPKKVFTNCGVKYTSPFGHKFVISLYGSE